MIEYKLNLHAVLLLHHHFHHLFLRHLNTAAFFVNLIQLSCKLLSTIIAFVWKRLSQNRVLDLLPEVLVLICQESTSKCSRSELCSWLY